MYSRYTVKAPQAPPDYGGTAFNPAVTAESPPAEAAVTDEADEKEIELSEPDDPGRVTPIGAYYADRERKTAETQAEEVKEAEKTEKSEENTENVITGNYGETAAKPAGGFSLDDLTLDDLLFMGALILLMSGKMGDESMLLLSYLLTCGL